MANRTELREWVERHLRAFDRSQILAAAEYKNARIKISMTTEEARQFAANLKALIDLADPQQ